MGISTPTPLLLSQQNVATFPTYVHTSKNVLRSARSNNEKPRQQAGLRGLKKVCPEGSYGARLQRRLVLQQPF
jgi:hypothetical protein